jgi:hypothetical protein
MLPPESVRSYAEFHVPVITISDVNRNVTLLFYYTAEV